MTKALSLRFNRKQLCIPYAAFLILFVICPLLVIIYYAFTNSTGEFTFDNLIQFFTNDNTLGTLLYSIAIAAVTTLICLVIAYPVAYILARSKFKKKYVLLMLFVLPMWINFTLRITALKEILTAIETNIAMYPFLNTVIGMTYDFLPFMILPLYTSLSKLDKSLTEAAEDLGANSFTVFMRVILPLSVYDGQRYVRFSGSSSLFDNCFRRYERPCGVRQILKSKFFLLPVFFIDKDGFIRIRRVQILIDMPFRCLQTGRCCIIGKINERYVGQ